MIESNGYNSEPIPFCDPVIEASHIVRLFIDLMTGVKIANSIINPGHQAAHFVSTGVNQETALCQTLLFAHKWEFETASHLVKANLALILRLSPHMTAISSSHPEIGFTTFRTAACLDDEQLAVKAVAAMEGQKNSTNFHYRFDYDKSGNTIPHVPRTDVGTWSLEDFMDVPHTYLYALARAGMAAHEKYSQAKLYSRDVGERFQHFLNIAKSESAGIVSANR